MEPNCKAGWAHNYVNSRQVGISKKQLITINIIITTREGRARPSGTCPVQHGERGARADTLSNGAKQVVLLLLLCCTYDNTGSRYGLWVVAALAMERLKLVEHN